MESIFYINSLLRNIPFTWLSLMAASKLTCKSPYHYSNIVDDFYTVTVTIRQLHFSLTTQIILES